ncbi:hypothetical protein [Okeania sp. SIO2B9]|uniref:hypothetical protein n=1 Tax=Okeania sp. SIO2B9 TaxID=2607782 RepID=UPI00338F812D
MLNPGLPPLIKSMMQPEFYPHSVHEPIELIQTHASYILLTGDYAYKIKKPVNFGFLDYSTLTARKHFIEEELRLNRRTARELYPEVVAICPTQTGYSFCPPLSTVHTPQHCSHPSPLFTPLNAPKSKIQNPKSFPPPPP